MAPVLTPRAKKREDRFFNIGVEGRRTGVTLEDKGVRDEHGLEPMEGIFSSPQKNSARSNKRKKSSSLATSVISDSTSMDVAYSSGPDPKDVLSSRRLTNGRLPPVSRSPLKTNLGATPRRGSSVGPLSSPTKQPRQPRAASQQPPETGSSDAEETRTSVEQGRRAPNSRLNGRNGPRSSYRTSYDASQSPDLPKTPSPVLEEDELEDAENAALMSELFGGEHDDENMPVHVSADEAEVAEPSEIEEQVEVEVVVQESLAPPRKRGRPPAARRSDVSENAEDEGDSQVVSARNILMSPRPSKRRTRASDVAQPPVDAVEEEQPDAEGDLDDPGEHPASQELLQDIESNSAVQPQKKRGRPPKTAKAEPRTKDNENPTNAPAEKPKAARGRPKAKAKAAAPAPQTSEPSPDADGEPTTKSGVPVGRQRERHQTPAEDDSLYTTQRGRNVMKPFEFWKGEKAVFAGDRLVDIIRREDITPIKRTYTSTYRPAAYQARKRRRRQDSIFQTDANDDDAEEWEATEPGIITGPVRPWDSTLHRPIADQYVDYEIAFAERAVQARDNLEGTFRFSKNFSTPFMGAGTVELPPGGHKGSKNSRKMQLVFFVHYGKVTVSVAEENRFVVTKGGMWTVPRGNTYAISNETDFEAKLFFAQACEDQKRDPASLEQLTQDEPQNVLAKT